MPITVAQAALRYAKAATPMGPDNQTTGQTAAPKAWNPGRSPAARQASKLTVTALKPKAPAPGCTMAAVLDYGREVARAGAGNCFEQCAAAALYLANANPAPVFRLVYLAPPADHIFVVIGATPNAAGQFPDAFAHWPAAATIVDPWVSICCPARDYPALWAMKLDVMAAGGEELPNPTGGWGRANAGPWRQAPVAHGKLSYTA